MPGNLHVRFGVGAGGVVPPAYTTGAVVVIAKRPWMSTISFMLCLKLRQACSKLHVARVEETGQGATFPIAADYLVFSDSLYLAWMTSSLSVRMKSTPRSRSSRSLSGSLQPK